MKKNDKTIVSIIKSDDVTGTTIVTDGGMPLYPGLAAGGQAPAFSRIMLV